MEWQSIDALRRTIRSERMSQLLCRHSEANAWLNLPGADLWPEEKAEREIELRETWAEIKRRRAAKTDRRAA